MIRPDELIIDNFAGGGGASLGIERALGRPVDIAVNHDPEAVAMHEANHPRTRHYCEDVWHVDPVEACAGRPVGLAWFSPDCKDFSKAKGGRPVSRRVRGLAWVVLKWAARVQPRVICLENVEEFQDWGPLTRSGRRIKARRGETFRLWVGHLRSLGYQVEWRELAACDFGAPTIRKRLFLNARRDGRPIQWAEPTHGPGLLPYRSAGECIDFSIPCPSIFGRKRPLAEATLRRIAKGIVRFVIEAKSPFIIPVTHHGDARVYDLEEPLRTITTAQRGEFALISPFMAQHNTGMVGKPVTAPLSTIVGKGCTQALVSSHLLKLRGSSRVGQDLREPAPTVTAGGKHLAEVRAFLIKYYGTAVGQDAGSPLHSVTTKARFGLVMIHGEPWQIVDIGMRMLAPRELYLCQGFPHDYEIAPLHNGKPLTITAQIRMCGNSVSPLPAEDNIRANFDSRASDTCDLMAGGG